MKYTKANEEPNTSWSLPEFIALHGSLNILQEYETGSWCGRFNNRGIWIHTHVEKKVRGISIPEILNDQDDYEVVVLDVYEEYCLCKKGCSIDYDAIYKDLYPYESDPMYFDVQEYYNENSDIFDGEIVW